MTCTSCGAQHDPGRKFCLECGAPLAVACGAGSPAAAKFCGECGGRLEPLGGLVMATLLDAGEPRIRALAAGRPVADDPVRSTEIGDAIPR